MSSVMRGYAENVTKNLTVMYTGNDLVNMTTRADLESCLNSLPSNAWTQVGDNGSVYMLATRANFATFASNVDTIMTSSSSNRVHLEASDMLRDMGEVLRFGVQGEDSSFLVFRKVQLTRAPLDGTGGQGSGRPNFGYGQVGYVVVENNYSGRWQSLTQLQCFVARV